MPARRQAIPTIRDNQKEMEAHSPSLDQLRRSSAPIALRYSVSIRACAHTNPSRQIVLTVTWSEKYGAALARFGVHSFAFLMRSKLRVGAEVASIVATAALAIIQAWPSREIGITVSLFRLSGTDSRNNAVALIR